MTHNDIYTKFMIEYDKANITSSYPSLTKYEVAQLLNKAYLALIAQKVTGNNPRKAPFEIDTKAIADIQPLITTVKCDTSADDSFVQNELIYGFPNDMLYYVSSMLNDSVVKLGNHQVADNFKQSSTNYPWIKNPICYLEDNKFHCLVDPDILKNRSAKNFILTYIKEPAEFVSTTDSTKFELSDTMAEELINLAILFATEQVESPRLQTKTSLIPLES